MKRAHVGLGRVDGSRSSPDCHAPRHRLRGALTPHPRERRAAQATTGAEQEGRVLALFPFKNWATSPTAAEAVSSEAGSPAGPPPRRRAVVHAKTPPMLEIPEADYKVECGSDH